MTKSERLEFSGNVAESLLEDAWLDAVLGRMLHISDVTEEKLTLLNVVNRIELDRVRGENLQKRTADLLEQAALSITTVIERDTIALVAPKCTYFCSGIKRELLDRVSKNRGIPVQMAARKTIPWHSDKPPPKCI
ncbi:unnamed protein product [Gongylonema pulchrum]|uniref:INSC_LBD domain-containing protein n=1 Tax=Gongylonema pulchrum TaxID=637853 RepID=A0A183E5I5_9BILA|nr:unnamed protein product [Gongylonema pulchrum]